ncbi:MAG: glycosyl transferase, partial [Clostridia bacterium]|nr:glycosyl transferase [Clostridia bacterium]
TEMTIHALDKNLALRNVLVSYRDRPEGSVSKLNTVSDGLKVLFTIVRLVRKYRPMAFYGILAGGFAVLTAGFGVLSSLLRGDAWFYLSCGSFFVSLSNLVCGLISDHQSRIDRSDFELKLNMMHKMFEENGDDLKE